jgi:hypothetical protein
VKDKTNHIKLYSEKKPKVETKVIKNQSNSKKKRQKNRIAKIALYKDRAIIQGLKLRPFKNSLQRPV